MNTSETDLAKKETRILMKKRLSALGEDDRKAASAAILSRLKQLPELREVKTVFCFISIQSEPETMPVIEYLLESGKRVCVPECLGEGVMNARFIANLDGLTPVPPYGILEPAAGSELADAAAIDLALVPGLAFDRNGGRLGRGAGYYDRYLRKSGAIRCGVCFDAMLLEKVPAGDKDEPMDLILTDRTLYRFDQRTNREDIHD